MYITEITGDGTAGPYDLPPDFDPISPQHILVHIGGAVQSLTAYTLDTNATPQTITFAAPVAAGQFIRLQLVQAAGGGTGQKLINRNKNLDGTDQEILTCPDQKQIAIAGLRFVNRTPEMDQAQVVQVEAWIENQGNPEKHHIVGPRTPVPVGSALVGGGDDKTALLPGQTLYARCSVAQGAAISVSGLEGDL